MVTKPSPLLPTGVPVFWLPAVSCRLSPGAKSRVSAALPAGGATAPLAPVGFVAVSAMNCGVGMYLGACAPCTSTVCPGPVMSVCGPPCCGGVPGGTLSMKFATAWLPSMVWFTVKSPPSPVPMPVTLASQSLSALEQA